MNISVIARKPFFDKFFVAPSMPGFLRIALTDALSFNKQNNTGGAINNYKDPQFLKLKTNSGLKSLCKEISDVKEHGNHVTFMLSISDIIQLGGASAIQYCGGPFIDVPIGRSDNHVNTSKTTALPQPEWNEQDIEKNLITGLDLTPKEVVALFGHRTLGFLANKKNEEDLLSRWSMNPYVFDNNYFVEILDKNSDYIKTPSDKALLNNSKYLEFVDLFARDQKAFFDEFSNVYTKVCQFGSQNLIFEGQGEKANI